MKSKRILSIIVLLVFSCTIMFAQSIVGKWRADDPTRMGLPSDAIATFNFQTNKKLVISLDVRMSRDIQAGMVMSVHAVVSLSANYAAVNGVLSMIGGNQNPTVSKFDVDFPGMEASKAAVLKQTIAPYIPQIKAEIVKQAANMNTQFGSSPYTISGNTLTIDGSTFTKIASAGSKSTAKKKK